jgi:hypothetical protein
VKACPKEAPRDLALADFARIIAALSPHWRYSTPQVG